MANTYRVMVRDAEEGMIRYTSEPAKQNCYGFQPVHLEDMYVPLEDVLNLIEQMRGR